MMKKLLAWILSALVLLGLCACESPDPVSTEPQTTPQAEPVTATGSFRLEIMGMEWGPVVSRVIVTLDRKIAAESVSDHSFRVLIPDADYQGITEDQLADGGIRFEAPVIVTGAYTCDASGKPAGDSEHIALELYYSPESPAPMLRSVDGGLTFCDHYELQVDLSDTAALKTPEGQPVETLRIRTRTDMDQTLYPQLENVFLDGQFTGSDGITLTYAAFAPAMDEHTHPLVIWLHGGGEGGTDVRSALYGNEVTALFSQAFQQTLGGAYVLVPQTPTRWMELEPDGSGSLFRETLMELIIDYVNQNPSIDPARVYVGGCSNGGFMTMDLLLHYPDYFAAAYPICGAYGSDYITDAQVQSIAHIPMWFIHAENDPVVEQERFLNVAYRLRDAGAEVHISLFPDVHDTSGRYYGEDGTAYQYIGHWSWIWFFNNDCEADGENLWQWLPKQHK